MEPMSKDKTVLIRRYANRKLYDVEGRSYITLKKVTQMIQAGKAIRVVDHVTGEDITSRVYAQILYELEKKNRGTLPAHILGSMIQAGEKGWASIREHLISSPDLSALVEKEITDRLSILEEHGEITSDEVSRLKDLLLVHSQRIRILSAAISQERRRETQETIDSLQDQLETLEKRIRKLEE